MCAAYELSVVHVCIRVNEYVYVSLCVPVYVCVYVGIHLHVYYIHIHTCKIGRASGRERV